MKFTTGLAGLVLVLGLAAPSWGKPRAEKKPQPAKEEPAKETSPEPWAVGITDEQRAAATSALNEGNDLYVQKLYLKALAAYRRGLESWDHPALRFSIARCLVMLGRSTEAYQNLTAALRYGAAPFEPEQYVTALEIKQLLDGQIAKLTVKCSNAGAHVTLDGQDLMTCPGEETRVLPLGSHQVVARKENYLTFAKDVVVLPKQSNRVDVHLTSLSEAATTERHWATWKPWAVLGAGVAVAAIGIPLQLQSSSDFADYRAGIGSECGDAGCLPEDIPQYVQDRESRAKWENRLAISAFALGGAAAATGIVLLFVNRPRTVLPENPQPAPPPIPAVTVIPLVSPNQAGLAVGLRF